MERVGGAWRGQGQQASACGVLQSAETAGEEAAGRWTEAVNTVDAHRGRGGDALIEQEILAAPDAGIAINLGRQQTDHGADVLATAKWLLACCDLRPVNSQAHAAFDRRLRVISVGNHFHAGDAQVDSL
jgi:hypothetical protein